MKYKYEPRLHTEEGYWYCEKLVYMSLPKCDNEEFATEQEAEAKCEELNDSEKCSYCKCVCGGDKKCIQCNHKCECAS